MLVGASDVPTIKSLKIALETLELLEVSLADVRILMNRSGAKVGLEDRDVERTLRREITYTLSSDKAIPISVNRGQPVVIDAPKSRVAKSFYDMARSLEPHKVSVDLLVTLAPFMQNPVPANVVRAVNYFQSPGWGAPLTAEPGFHGKLSNVDVGDDWTIAHISIDKSARIHAEISRDIAALSQAKEGPQDGAANPLTAAAPQSPQKKFPPQAEAQ